MTEVILFAQETCGACATQREKNEGIEDEFPGVSFREVDIREDMETAEEYGVRKTPTTLVFADGEQVAEFVGVVDRDELDAAIESATRHSPGLAERLVSIVR